MLTSDLGLSWRKGNKVTPRYIDPDDRAHLELAQDLLAIVEEHRGYRRCDLESSLDDYVGAGTDYKVLRGLIKLLMDRCEFVTDSPVDPVEIRRAVFLKAREHHPAIQSLEVRDRAIDAAAAALGRPRDEVIDNLYADLSDNQALAAFEAVSPADLLHEYNLAQAQALLYRAVAMDLRVDPQEPAGYRQLFGAIKAYGLVHAIRGSAERGYDVRLDGPVSMFHRSQKYGVQMAVFLPALLGCSHWRMRAEIDYKFGGSAFYDLDSRQTLLRAPEWHETRDQAAALDKFIANWSAKGFGEAEPTREVIDLGEGAFIPDAIVRREGYPEFYLEVLGFWTPKYLAQRLRELERGGFRRFVLAASEELLASRDAPGKLPPNVVLFKSSIDPKAVSAAMAAALK